MKQEIYKNYKCYNKKDKRIAVFGREKEGKIEIFELYCSPTDNFKKLTPIVVYDGYLSHGLTGIPTKFHPKIYFIDIKPGDRIQFTFSQYCKNNFYHKFERNVTYTETYLYKNNCRNIILKAKRSSKSH